MAKVAMYVKMIEVLAAAGVIVLDKKAAMKFRSRFEINECNVEEKINGGLIDVILFCRKRMSEWGYASISDDVIIRAMSQDIGFYMNHWDNPVQTENGQLFNALYEELQHGIETGEVVATEKKHRVHKFSLPAVIKTKTGEKNFSTAEEMFRPCSIFMPQWNKQKEQFKKFHTMPIPMHSNVVKGDIVIRNVNCRIWLNKKSLSGIVKLNDDSDKKLLSFEWGKNHKGEWFKDPKVVQGSTQLRYTGRYVYDQIAKEWTILMDEPNKRNFEVIMAVKDAIARLYHQKAA